MIDYSPDTLKKFESVTTATLTTVLLKMGLKNVWIREAFALEASQNRVVGPAFTLRFIPERADLATPESWNSPQSTRAAIEAMPQGCVTVVDAGGCRDAGIFGDILCQRMKVRKIAAMVTDGVVRDLEGVLQTGLDVWAAGTTAPASISGLTFVNWQEPIGCGGVAIYPNDLIVADQDGAVVVPAKLADEVLAKALEQEDLEGWILNEVKNGAALPGLYPINDENRKRFEVDRKKQQRNQ